MNYGRVTAKRPWSPLIGYSRAVRRGPLIEIGGTSATQQDGTVFAPGDPYEQTKHVFGVVIDAVRELGGQKSDIVRTRVFLTDISHWEQVGRAHGEFFADLLPASTFVEVSKLLLPELVIEIEATAYVLDGSAGQA